LTSRPPSSPKALPPSSPKATPPRKLCSGQVASSFPDKLPPPSRTICLVLSRQVASFLTISISSALDHHILFFGANYLWRSLPPSASRPSSCSRDFSAACSVCVSLFFSSSGGHTKSLEMEDEQKHSVGHEGLGVGGGGGYRTDHLVCVCVSFPFLFENYGRPRRPEPDICFCFLSFCFALVCVGGQGGQSLCQSKKKNAKKSSKSAPLHFVF
jgi:hypothetical protein